MLSNLMIGKYYGMHSTIENLNPLSKIISTFIFVIMTLFISNIQLGLALFLFVLVLILNTKIPLKVYLKSLMSLKMLLIFIVLINLIMNTATEIIMISLTKIILIVLYTSILTMTTKPSELTKGLEKFLIPLVIIKVPVNKIALSLSLALRFIPTIINEANKILKSQASRGVDYYNTDIKGKIMAIRTMLFPMFILSLKKADSLSDVMEVRLYDINAKRSSLREKKWTLFDTYTIMVHLLMLLIVIIRGVII